MPQRQRPAPNASGARSRPTLRSTVAVVAVLLSVAGIVAFKATRTTPQRIADHAQPFVTATNPASTGRPRLLDLGADRCIPCKAMAPILEELRREYAATLQVDFVDVWKHPEAGDPYRIASIPTQIFFDPQGRELFRHEGFMGKTAILETWARLGYPIQSMPGRHGS